MAIVFGCSQWDEDRGGVGQDGWELTEEEDL